MKLYSQSIISKIKEEYYLIVPNYMLGAINLIPQKMDLFIKIVCTKNDSNNVSILVSPFGQNEIDKLVEIQIGLKKKRGSFAIAVWIVTVLLDLDIMYFTGTEAFRDDIGIAKAICHTLKDKAKIQSEADKLIAFLVEKIKILPENWKEFLEKIKNYNKIIYENLKNSQKQLEEKYKDILKDIELEMEEERIVDNGNSEGKERNQIKPGIGYFIPEIDKKCPSGKGKYFLAYSCFDEKESEMARKHWGDARMLSYDNFSKIKKIPNNCSFISLPQNISDIIIKNLGDLKNYFVVITLELNRNSLHVHIKPKQEKMLRFQCYVNDVEYMWKIVQTLWENKIDGRTGNSARFIPIGVSDSSQERRLFDFTANVEDSNYVSIGIKNLPEILKWQLEEEAKVSVIDEFFVRKILGYYPYEKSFSVENIHLLRKNNSGWYSIHEPYYPIEYSDDIKSDNYIEKKQRKLKEDIIKENGELLEKLLDNNCRDYYIVCDVEPKVLKKKKGNKEESTLVCIKNNNAIVVRIKNFNFFVEKIKNAETEALYQKLQEFVTSIPKSKENFLKKVGELLHGFYFHLKNDVNLTVDSIGSDNNIIQADKEAVKEDIKKKIKIFLASSIIALKEERNAIEIFISRENDHLCDQGIYLKLEKAEKISSTFEPGGKQLNINKIVLDSDIFICLISDKVGQYTIVEYDTAYESFKNGGKPKKIYVFFKKIKKDNNDNLNDLKTREEFMNRIKECEQFYDDYENIDDLLLKMERNMRTDLKELGVK